MVRKAGRRKVSRKRDRVIAALLGGGMLLCACTARAAVQEQVLMMPVTVPDTPAGRVPAQVTVTVLRDDRFAGPRPWVLLLHGRPLDHATFPRLGRQRFPATADWLAAQGLVVIVPTRLGYGFSAGPDLEDTGGCDTKQFGAPLARAAQVLRIVLAGVQQRIGLTRQPGAVLGESFGGLLALQLADGRLPGLRAVIAVAAGDGGRRDRPGDPCGGDRLAGTLGALGQAAQLPSLWLYGRHDSLWGTQWPDRWFAAWRSGAAAGQGAHTSLLWLPVEGHDGHLLLVRDPDLWHAPVLQALRAAGVLGHGHG